MKVAKTIRGVLIAVASAGVVSSIGVATPANGAQPLATVQAIQTEQAGGRPSPSEPTRMPGVEDPISLGSGLEIVYYSFFNDDYGNVQMLGEFRNVGGDAIANPKARFVLYDDGGNVIDTLDANAVLPVVEPGESVPMRGFVNDVQVGEWATEEPSLCQGYDDPAEYSTENLELRDVEELAHEEDHLEVEGQVYNGNTTPIGNVAVIALAYQNGRYVGSGRAPLRYEIPAERSGKFELSAYGTDLAGVDGKDYTYDLWVGVTPNVTVHTC